MSRQIKKSLNKIIPSKIRSKSEDLPHRITNETVEEHREQILAGGRKFKYPMQYVKHRLVYTAVAIAVGVLVIFSIISWWELYPAKSTNDFFYKVTRVLPLPVARVDGWFVPYEDYLMKYRSSIYYLEHVEQTNIGNSDVANQLNYYQLQAMHEAVANAYARKIASERGIKVTATAVDNFIKDQRQSLSGEVSTQTYDTVIYDYYGWSPDEYRYAIENILLKQAVAYAVDDTATSLLKTVQASLSAGYTDLQAITNQINTSSSRKLEFVDAGWLPKSNNDNGLSKLAATLKVATISSVYRTTNGDGYYFIKLNNISDTQVNYSYLKIPLKTFEDSVLNLENNGKVQYYISLPKKEG